LFEFKSILNKIKYYNALYIMSQQTSITSLVYNAPYAKQLGVPPFYYRYRSCNPNFPNRTQTSVSGFTPADQYQKLQIIQDTVRVYGSLYTANLGPLTAYKRPLSDPQQGFYGVCWNQMSDRPVPSVQRASIPTGYGTAMNRRHTSVTSSKPGSQTPGGKGCDIKHNSYDRYLNRLKGKGPMRRGVVPPEFGKPIVFNPAFPIYGGKTIKTSIINDCQCPNQNKEQDLKIYNNPLWQPYPSGNISFNVGDYVYAIQNGTDYYARAIVTAKSESDIYTIQFNNGAIQTATISELLIYFPCNCGTSYNDSISFSSGILKSRSSIFGLECVILKSKFNV
jgi:hypothetical protein